MAKAYTNVNSTTGTFAGWLSKANELYYDMSTIIVTAKAVSLANLTNESTTTGNSYVNGIFSSNELVVKTALRGGTVTTSFANSQTLLITSNTQIGSGSSADNLFVYGDATVKDDLNLTSDGSIVSFGTNSEITLTHVHNVGLTLTHVTAGDNLPVVLQLKSEEDVVEANEVIASLEFAAGDSDGTDGATIAAGIHAIAEGAFSASSNATKLVFTTGVSETAASSATAKATLSSIGDFQVAGDLVLKDGGLIGSASDLDALSISSAGVVNFTARPTFAASLTIQDGGSLGSASDLDAVTISSGGVVAVTATTVSTSKTTGALTVAGGAGVALDLSVGDDLRLISDAAVLGFGADGDVTLTHVADTGLLLNSTMAIQFNDASQSINAPTNATLNINATDEIELNATLLDVNANINASGTYTGAGLMTTGGNIIIPDAGTIGSASDLDAIAIGADGDVTLTQDLELQHDAATISFGADGDVTLTHVHNTGILLNSTMAIQFNDASQSINAPTNAILDINATDEIELNATLLDVNANINASGTYTGAGLMTTGGSIIIPNAGTIGSASDTDAISISSGGVVAVTATTASSAVNNGALTVAGGAGIAGDLSIGDDLRFLSDAAVVSFGTNSEITLAHVHNVGLTLTHVTAGDNLPIVLQLKSEEDEILANEVIASLEFAAGDSDGTDGATVAAGIHAIAEGTFSASANATKLVFTTGVSETAASSATAKATLSSIGDLQVAGDLVVKDGGLIGSASDLDALSISSGGVVNFTARPTFAASLTIQDGGSLGSASDPNAVTISSAGVVAVTATTASSANNNGALTVAGGAGIAGDLFVGDNVDITGNLVVDGTATFAGSGNFTVNNSIVTTLSVVGNTDIGNATSDTVTITARVDSDVVPSSDSARTLGTDALRWTHVYADNVHGIGTTLTALNASNISDGTIADARLPASISSNITGNAATATTLTSLTTTVTELNKVDGGTAASSITAAGADRVVYNDAGAMKQVALTTLDTYFSGTTKTLTNKTLTSPSIGTGFTFDGITFTTAQTSAETFADNDTSLMTAAAIDDRAAVVAQATIDADSTLMQLTAAAVKTAGDLTFNDSVAINLGTGADTEIFHSGSHLYADINTGNFYIRDGTDSNATALTFAPTTGALTLWNNDASDDGPTLTLRHNSASPAATDEVGQIFFQADNAAGTNHSYAYLDGRIVDPTTDSEDGSLTIYTVTAGTNRATIKADSGVAYLYNGSSVKLATASGGVTITGTATATTFSGAFSGSGASITALNASNISSGTIADARLPTTAVKTTGNQTIAGTKTFSSTIAGSITGSAATLTTARTIGGTSFNGSANIAVALAATATTLATARTIGGVSFNGSANINLPGVNAAGNQSTSGNAATVTNGVYTTGNQTIAGNKTFSDTTDFNGAVTLDGATTSSTSFIVDGGYMKFDDGLSLRFGSDSDAEIYHNGSHLYADINTGNFYIRDGTDSNATAFTFIPSTGSLTVYNNDSGAQGPDLILKNDSASPASNDETGQIFFQADNAAGTNHSYASIQGLISDPTTDSEDGILTIYTVTAGTNRATIKAASGVATLYNAGNAKLATASGGVTITGTATATIFAGSGASLTSLNASNISSGTLASARIADSAVTSAKLGADAVTGAKIADNAINSEHYTDGSIDLAHMSANSVDSNQYVDGSIDLVHMSVNSVDSNQYVDGSIDLAHMSANSVDSNQYVDGSIDKVHLAADIVDGTKIADNAIGAEHIAANAVGASEIAADAVGASELNVSGNGSSTQFLRSDGDGSFTWITPTDTGITSVSVATSGSGNVVTGLSVSISGRALTITQTKGTVSASGHSHGDGDGEN